MVNPRLALAVIVLGAVLGLGAYECRNQRVVIKESAAADQNHQQAATHTTQGVKHDQAAEAVLPKIQADAAEVARLRAENKRLKAALAVGNPVVASPLGPLVANQDALIEAQTQENAGLKVQVSETAAARDEYRAAAGESKAEADHLRTALQHTPAFRPLAVGVLYGTDQSMGAWVEYDIGPVRAGVDVVRRPAGTTGRTTLEAVGRVGWRF